MSNSVVVIDYHTEDGTDTVYMRWDGVEASAPIYVDGVVTQYRTADAKHSTEDAVRLVCALTWGAVYETKEAAPSGVQVTIWDDVAFDTLKGADEHGCEDAQTFVAEEGIGKAKEYVDAMRSRRSSLPDEALIHAMGQDWILKQCGFVEGVEDSEGAWEAHGLPWCEAYNKAFQQALDDAVAEAES